jgi:hypothetical protein
MKHKLHVALLGNDRRTGWSSNGTVILLFGVFGFMWAMPAKVHALSTIPLNRSELLFQLNKATQTFYASLSEPDGVPGVLDHCPDSSEVKHKGTARNPAKMYDYARLFFSGISLLKDDLNQAPLVKTMKDALYLMGDNTISSRLEISESSYGWNNLSSDWEAWGNGTCTSAGTPNLYASGLALLILNNAFEMSEDPSHKRAYYDAFLKGANYWLNFSSNPLLQDGSTYTIRKDSGERMDVAAIRQFYNLKPKSDLFNLVMVGGQKTDFCPGPYCGNAAEIAANTNAYLETSYTIPRPFRFTYTKDDPGLVSVNCSGILGLALLRMGVALRKTSGYAMPVYRIPVTRRDGINPSYYDKDLYYVGYWTVYSIYYNLAQNPSNASYVDVDTPNYVNPRFEAHLATLTAPFLAEAGTLLKNSDYIQAATRAVLENASAIHAETAAGRFSPAMYSYCPMRFLDDTFSVQCDSLTYKFSHYSDGRPDYKMSPSYLGLSINQMVANLNDTTPPMISSLGSVLETSSTITIEWSTDEPASSQIEFGPATDYGSKTILDFGKETAMSHNMRITGLPANTLFHYRAISEDNNANRQTSEDRTFVLDGTPPPAPSLSANGALGSLELGWSEVTDGGGSGLLRYRIDVSTNAEFTSFVSGWRDRDVGVVLSTTVPDLLRSTRYFARMRAEDKAGNRSLDSFTRVAVTLPDVISPSISWASLPSSLETTPRIVRISVIAEDNISVTKVWFILNDVVVSTDTTSPYEYSWPITGANNGTYAWKSAAFDAMGNSSTTVAVPVTVNIDITPPAVALTTPTAGTTYTTPQTVPVKATATDAVGVTKVWFILNDVVVSTDTVSPYQYSWPITGANNGAYAWKSTAFDAMGNSSTTVPVPVTVNIDITPPAVALTTPTAGAIYTTPQSVPVKATATDAVGVTKVWFVLNDVVVSTDTVSPYQYTWAITGANNGAYAWKSTAFDAMGNSSSTVAVPVTVNIDVLPPSTPVLQSPTELSATSVRLNWSAATDNVRVIGYRLYRDTSLIATIGGEETSFLDSGLAPETLYKYTVAAFDDMGNTSAMSPELSVTTPRRALLAPRGSLSGVSPQSVGIRWTSVEGANRYTLAASLSVTSGHEFSLQREIPASEASDNESISGLSPNTTYYLYLNACNEFDCTDFVLLGSAVTHALAPALTAAEGKGKEVRLTINANGNPAGTKYRIEMRRGGKNSHWRQQSPACLPSWGTSPPESDTRSGSRRRTTRGWPQNPPTP